MLIKDFEPFSGLVNGSRGVVVGFGAKGPLVKFASQSEPRMIEPERFGIKLGGQIVFRRQIPLRLAWAMSIHKSQGMSLDLAQVKQLDQFKSGGLDLTESISQSCFRCPLAKRLNMARRTLP